MKTALEKKQTKAIFDTFLALNDIGKISAIGQAVALWTVRDNLSRLTGNEYPTSAERDAEFEEVMFSKVGYASETIRRYLLAWEFMLDVRGRIAAETWEQFVNRPIKDLIALGQAMHEHGPLSKKMLLELAKTPDNATLRAGIRKEVAHEEKESTLLVIKLDATGSLVAWQGQQCEHVGYLLLEPSPLRDKARARILRRAGIQVSQ